MLALSFALGVFALGASIGSFLNVVIYRLPHGLSVVRPASRCPACETPIAWYHNVPILGWLGLRGRCASCKVAISARYALVELALGVLALALFHDLSGGPLTAELIASEHFLADVVGPFVLYLAFVAILVAITFIDLDHFIIPDVLSLPAIPLGIATSAVFGHAVGVSWMDGLIGALVGAGSIITIILVYGALTGREGMGGGDWKLLGALGAWLGWSALPFVLFAASVQGIVMTLVLGRAFAVDELPPEPGQGLDAAPPPLGEPMEPPADPTLADRDPHAAKAREELVAVPLEEQTSFGQLAIPFGPFLALAGLEFLYFRAELRELMDRWLAS